MSEIEDGLQMTLPANEDGAQLKRKLLGCSELISSPPKRNCPTNVSLIPNVMSGIESIDSLNVVRPILVNQNLFSIPVGTTESKPMMDNLAHNIFSEIELSPSKFGKELPSNFGKGLNEKNLRNKINEIKKRRSSAGRGLLSRKSTEFSNKNQLDSPITKDSLSQEVKENSLGCINNTQALSLMTLGDKEIPESKQNQIIKDSSGLKTSRIVSFEDKTNVLRHEYSKWKELKSNRATRLCKAEREFKEAKSGDTVIEEDEVVPHLSENIKSFLAAKPNYEQYIQEVRIAKEQLDLTHDEIQKVLLIHQKVLHVSKLVSEAAFVTLENETFGDLQTKNVKDLLKNMLK